VRKPNEPLGNVSASTVTQNFWRNLAERDELLSKSETRQDEFLPETLDDSLPNTTITRRGFISLVGAATAVATAACSTRERTIVPYTKRPTEVIPGVANYYASTYPEGDTSFPVLVKTREGRPIHIVGNDESPRFKGKTSIRAIADIIGLYDPDRLRAPMLDGQLTNWEAVEKKLSEIVGEASRDSKPILLLTGATDSPTRKTLLNELKIRVKTFDARHWEPGRGEAARAADEAVFGVPTRKRLRLDRTNTILAFGADFLSGDNPETIAAFTNKRQPAKPTDGMSRLWVFESRLSLTGANADHRFTLKPTDVATIAFALAYQLHILKGFTLPDDAILPSFQEDRLDELHIPKDLWHALLDELAKAKSDAVAIASDDLPIEAQIAVHLLNEMLGSRGVELSTADPILNSAELEAILQDMEKGHYFGVILWGVNPVYSFRDTTRIRSAFEKVPNRIWIGTVVNESTSLCQWHLPENHWLESWGDHTYTGQLTLQQPTVMPLYDSRSGEDILLFAFNSLGGETFPDYYSFLLNRWRKDVYTEDTPATFEQFFNAALHDGVLHRELTASKPPGFRGLAISRSAQIALAGQANADSELLIYVSTQLYDGRFANNGWLQELPDPVTKNTWGNPLLVSVGDAKRLGLDNGDVVEIDSGECKVTTPVLIQPGQAQGVFAIALGYGQTVGSVARDVGVNAFSLLGRDTSSPNIRQSIKVHKTGSKVRLPLTQSHHRMHGRDLVRMMTLSEFGTKTNSPHKQLDLVTLYPSQRFPEHKWGMVVDLAACIGCSACVIGCQSENNIPTVGAKQVERGREMHWIRIDSYYEGVEDNPHVVHQPMLCQHCDSAPCENVCPVNATNHSPDGLNQMAYNRCVGTRYCANNCPYKVRRYNFFDYTSEKTEPAKLVYNPEVTVRPRGVMEKCTFCVQKIEDARMRAKTEKRAVRDGEIVPACAAACPSSAIVFGNLNSATSLVSQASRNKRGYKVLEEIGARPAVTYLAALRNPVALGGGND
jgi:molybdopterin-containing oxidoreductase family iron-sulfur binding subunit